MLSEEINLNEVRLRGSLTINFALMTLMEKTKIKKGIADDSLQSQTLFIK